MHRKKTKKTEDRKIARANRNLDSIYLKTVE